MSKGLKVPTNPAMALRALNAQHAVSQTEDTNNTTILQTDNTTDRQTNNQTDRQTNPPTNNNTNLQTDEQTVLPANTTRNKPTRRPSGKQVAKSAPHLPVERAAQPTPRLDGRTLRARNETLDTTMVTSMRLSVATIDQLDEFCWRHRQRKQDVIQEALTLYFQTMSREDQQEQK